VYADGGFWFGFVGRNPHVGRERDMSVHPGTF